MLGRPLEPVWGQLQQDFKYDFPISQYWDGVWSQFKVGFKKASSTIPQYWVGTWSQFEVGFKKASNAIPQYWDGI